MTTIRTELERIRERQGKATHHITSNGCSHCGTDAIHCKAFASPRGDGELTRLMKAVEAMSEGLAYIEEGTLVAVEFTRDDLLRMGKELDATGARTYVCAVQELHAEEHARGVLAKATAILQGKEPA